MKKIYQIPEIELHFTGRICFDEVESFDGESNTNLSNEKNFDEGELSTDIEKSNLWED